MSAQVKSTPPEHVPPELVRDFDVFDFHHDPLLTTRPFDVFDSLRDMQAFWSPNYRGYWVLTSAEDIRFVWQHPEIFSSEGASSNVFGRSGWPTRLIPEELDPPEHGKYRRALTRPFSPGAVFTLGGRVEEVCHNLIATIAEKKECEFLDEFARPFPTTIFTEILGIPTAESAKFLRWNYTIQHSLDPAEKAAAGTEIREYLLEFIRERIQDPQDDLVGHLIASEIDGHPMSEDDLLGTCFLMFMAGLDTVTAALGFVFKYLAEHPEDRMVLAKDPNKIDDAIEELLRVHSFVQLTRVLTQDYEIAGVRMRKGDPVVIVTAMATRDPSEFENPAQVDLDRVDNRHLAFGAGPHRCLGSHLARRELQVAVREWLRVIPNFEIRPGFEAEIHGSAAMGLESLELVWP